MKRIFLVVIFCICFLFGFLILDKFFFHLVFRSGISNGDFNNKDIQYQTDIKPGNCLILEEKYCKEGKLIYDGENISGIFYKTKPNVPLFSPDNNNYSMGVLKNSEGFNSNLIIVGDDIFDYGVENERLWYEIYFPGKLLNNFDNSGVIKKGETFAYTSFEGNELGVGVFLIIKKVSYNNIDGIVEKISENYLKELVVKNE